MKTLEHELKKWEIRYGYLNIKAHTDWRQFFRSVLNKKFAFNVFGEELFERKIDNQGRIYIGRSALRNLKAGEIVSILLDAKGNYQLERKRT